MIIGRIYYSRSCPRCGEPGNENENALNKVPRPKHGYTNKNCPVICVKCHRRLDDFNK